MTQTFTFRHLSGLERTVTLTPREYEADTLAHARNTLNADLAADGLDPNGWHLVPTKPVERAVNLKAVAGKETR